MNHFLHRAVNRVAQESDFLANDLFRMASFEQSDNEWIASQLRIDAAQFEELGLCRSPRRDAHFREDVEAVAEFVHGDDWRLGNMLRLADGLRALSSVRSSNIAPLLAAARQANETSVRKQGSDQRLQPKWLVDAANLIAGKTTQRNDVFPRQLEFNVLWQLPLAIVELPGLSGLRVVDWLASRGVNLPVHTPPGALRGALVAFAGSGVLFVDTDDSPEERRVTVAHEAAHFVADYWIPRLEIANRVPHLLAVVDGQRDPIDEDLVDAAVARIPIGLQTHLFERDAYGSIPTPEIGKREDRATRIAWEVLAPQHAVVDRVTGHDEFTLIRVLETDFGLPRETAREYSAHLRRALWSKGDTRRFDWGD